MHGRRRVVRRGTGVVVPGGNPCLGRLRVVTRRGTGGRLLAMDVGHHDAHAHTADDPDDRHAHDGDRNDEFEQRLAALVRPHGCTWPKMPYIAWISASATNPTTSPMMTMTIGSNIAVSFFSR